MNSENSRTSRPHRQLSNFSDKMDLKRSGKYVALSSLASMHIFKKHGPATDNIPIKIYVYK